MPVPSTRHEARVCTAHTAPPQGWEGRGLGPLRQDHGGTQSRQFSLPPSRRSQAFISLCWARGLLSVGSDFS